MQNKFSYFILHVSDPPYETFSVTLLHPDTSADHPRRNSSYKNQDWSNAALY